MSPDPTPRSPAFRIRKVAHLISTSENSLASDGSQVPGSRSERILVVITVPNRFLFRRSKERFETFPDRLALSVKFWTVGCNFVNRFAESGKHRSQQGFGKRGVIGLQDFSKIAEIAVHSIDLRLRLRWNRFAFKLASKTDDQLLASRQPISNTRTPSGTSAASPTANVFDHSVLEPS